MKSWSPKRMPDAVARYERAFSWELDTSFLRSGLPYSGCVRARLRRRAAVPKGPGFHRFAQLHDWVGLWEPRRHTPVCPLTADLLATAHALGGRLCFRHSPGGPGGYHAEVHEVWIALHDGGVGVEVRLCEHPTTNRVRAAQRATIRGNAAFRAVTRAMGFDHLARRLPGEASPPDFEAIDRDVTERLAAPRPALG
jgi:hypothetical protein